MASAPITQSPAAVLERRIAERTACVGVVGLGYVGLPLLHAFHQAGFPVLGFDIDPAKVEALRAGRPYIRHLGAAVMEELAGSDRCDATTDLARAGEADALLLCVPTPLTKHREPDLSYVERTARDLAPHLRPGQLVVLESTTYPGTTTELLVPRLLEGTGLRVGESLFVAYSPEREDPGNPHYGPRSIPKVVGADDPVSQRLAEALYGAVVAQVVPVSSSRAAEAVKLLENIFRAVNIALVNELKIVFHRMGIDVFEVIEAAKTKPFGFMAFYPGPGLGGHCIPIDPFYLTWKAREYGLYTRFIELAGEVNTAVTEYVVGRVVEALNAQGKPVKSSRILLLGLAYKPDIDDTRESPTFVVWDRLEALGAEVAYYDPHVPVVPPTREHPHRAGVPSVPWDEATLRAFDAAVVLTHHRAVDYDALVTWLPLVIDSRGVLRRAAARFPGKVWAA